MSRTKKGSKPTGYEYWGKMKGGGMVDRKTSTKMQRMFDKEELRKLVNESLQDMQLDVDLTDCVIFKSLFPSAKSIACFNDLVFGYSPIIVDGKYVCVIEDVNELLSFQYHTGCSYKDYSDLHRQYFDLFATNERGWYLP